MKITIQTLSALIEIAKSIKEWEVGDDTAAPEENPGMIQVEGYGGCLCSADHMGEEPFYAHVDISIHNEDTGTTHTATLDDVTLFQAIDTVHALA